MLVYHIIIFVYANILMIYSVYIYIYTQDSRSNCTC